jgi:ribosomal protein S16
MSTWKYNNKELKECPKWAYGFIYEIILNNKDEPAKPFRYYGQKTIWTDNKRLIGVKELIEKGKGQFRKYKSKRGDKKGKWIYFEPSKEETWQNYPSSSDIVKKMIYDGVTHTKTVLEFVSQKGLLNWEEMKQIVCNACLEDENCLNKRIGSYHSRNIINALKKDSKIDKNE